MLRNIINWANAKLEVYRFAVEIRYVAGLALRISTNFGGSCRKC